MIHIKHLPPAKWKEYKNLRLEALKSDPIAFGSSYEEEIKLSESDWKRRIKNALFAFVNNEPVGIVTYIFNSRLKTKHIANIFGVYVKKQYRNSGIGRTLIENVLTLIKKNKHIVKINLHVNKKQYHAIKLYKACGFKQVGLLRKDLYVNGKFYDEQVMEKFVKQLSKML